MAPLAAGIARARSAAGAAAGRLRGCLAELEAFALPQRCPGCGAPARAERLLCDPCWSAIPRLEEPLCVRCLAAGREPVGCGRHAGFRVFPAWIYDERAALLVHALKYGARPGLAVALGAAIAAALPTAYRPDLVAGVPLHTVRRRERGYDQAARLAAVVAARRAAPWLPGALERVRPTRPQARLGPAERRANLAGAFRVARPTALEGRRILVVDDVVTTGSTLEACLQPLAASGAHAVAAALAWAP